jgi:hypothetical protein
VGRHFGLPALSAEWVSVTALVDYSRHPAVIIHERTSIQPANAPFFLRDCRALFDDNLAAPCCRQLYRAARAHLSATQ